MSRVYVIGKGRCGRTLFVFAEDRLLHDVLLPRVVDDANVYTGKQQQEQTVSSFTMMMTTTMKSRRHVPLVCMM